MRKAHTMKIIVDEMGGDHAPEAPVEAAVKAGNVVKEMVKSL